MIRHGSAIDVKIIAQDCGYTEWSVISRQHWIALFQKGIHTIVPEAPLIYCEVFTRD
jgi:hypothetical protein